MIKVVRLVKRRRDLTREQFKDYWLTKHSQLEKKVAKGPVRKKIVASFATGEMLGGKEPPFDGMVELYFDSVEDMRANFAGESPGIMHEDEKNFVDLSEEMVRTVTEEYAMADTLSEKDA